MTDTAPLLDELATVAAAIAEHRDQLEQLYARRSELYVQLRAADPPVEHKVIARVAGVTVPAVIQQCTKAEQAAAP